MGIVDDVNLRIDELTEKVAYLTGQVDMLVRMHLGVEPPAQGPVSFDDEDEPDDGTN